MSQATIIGLDLAKNVFQLQGAAADGLLYSPHVRDCVVTIIFQVEMVWMPLSPNRHRNVPSLRCRSTS
jgi:hypothetical protein